MACIRITASGTGRWSPDGADGVHLKKRPEGLPSGRLPEFADTGLMIRGWLGGDFFRVRRRQVRLTTKVGITVKLPSSGTWLPSVPTTYTVESE